MYAEEMVKIQAQENLNAVSVAAIGAGTMDQHARETTLSLWRRQMGGVKAIRHASFEELAAMGIGVQVDG